MTILFAKRPFNEGGRLLVLAENYNNGKNDIFFADDGNVIVSGISSGIAY